MLDSVERWNWAVRISVVGLFVIALVVIAFKMASVVVPLVLAWVFAMVLLPVVDGLERRGLSRVLTSIVLVILLIASIMVIVGVLTVPLTYWLGRASELGALLKERLQTLGNPFAFFDEGTARQPDSVLGQVLQERYIAHHLVQWSNLCP